MITFMLRLNLNGYIILYYEILNEKYSIFKSRQANPIVIVKQKVFLTLRKELKLLKSM